MERPDWLPELVEIKGEKVRVYWTTTGRVEWGWTDERGHRHWACRDENGTRTLDLALAERLLG